MHQVEPSSNETINSRGNERYTNIQTLQMERVVLNDNDLAYFAFEVPTRGLKESNDCDIWGQNEIWAKC